MRQTWKKLFYIFTRVKIFSLFFVLENLNNIRSCVTSKTKLCLFILVIVNKHFEEQHFYLRCDFYKFRHSFITFQSYQVPSPLNTCKGYSK